MKVSGHFVEAFAVPEMRLFAMGRHSRGCQRLALEQQLSAHS